LTTTALRTNDISSRNGKDWAIVYCVEICDSYANISNGVENIVFGPVFFDESSVTDIVYLHVFGQ